MNIDSLPPETLIDILIRTNGVTLGKCRRVCKKWKEIIDSLDILWEKMCYKEYRHQSLIAKRKSDSHCKWSHIYKNMTMWEKVTSFEKNIRQFYKFSLNDKNHALDIHYGVLPLRDMRGIVLYDMSTLRYIPVAVPEKNCLKISNNDYATVILLKSGILLQRTVDDETFMTEAFFKADNFVLDGEELYFFNKRDVYICDLAIKNLESKLILRSKYDIKEIECSKGNVYIFTECGRIIIIAKNGTVSIKAINCPPDWVKQIKHISAINDKNFICYSRSLFKIETDKQQHLYLEFPPFTSLFFYGHFVLIGTPAGEILLYRLENQIRTNRPAFETLAHLPDGKFALQLDVSERNTGPVIIATTFIDVIMVEIDFFPNERDTQMRILKSKISLYKRLLQLRDRLRLGVPSVKSIA